MTSAVYVAGKLVAHGDCPICGGKLHAMKCQRKTCGTKFSSLFDLQATYEIVAKVTKVLNVANPGDFRDD